MAYIESFLLYVAVVLFVFVVLFGGVVLLYMLWGQIKLFWANEDVTLQRERDFLYKLIKNRFFKFAIVAYFITWIFFYINQSLNYYGKDRAYPQAKAYAIVADTVWFWQSMMVNVAINRGWGEYDRLLRPDDKLDKKIQKLQTYLLNKMYIYIPKEDGERDYWYYRYKQYYKAQIRYKPDSIFQPSEKIIEIMNDMHKTSHALYEKPIKDSVIDKERYLPIAQMSYYLVSDEGYFTPFERIDYLSRLFKFMSDKALFQKAIKYNTLLTNVYTKIKNDKEVAKKFDEHPYLKGLFYAALTSSLDDNIVYDTHYGKDICTNKKMHTLVEAIQDFYAWIFREKKSSFQHLGQRQKRQVLWLYGTTSHFSYQLSRYLCKIPYRYRDKKYLPEYSSEEEFYDEAVTVDDYVKFTNTEKILNKIKNKEK